MNRTGYTRTQHKSKYAFPPLSLHFCFLHACSSSTLAAATGEDNGSELGKSEVAAVELRKECD